MNFMMALNSVLVLLAICMCVSVEANYPTQFVKKVQDFPDIMSSDRTKCLPKTGKYSFSSNYVCDPNGILNIDEVNLVNKALNNINSLKKDDSACNAHRPKPVVTAAITDRMGVGRAITDTKRLNYAAIFAYYLYDVWNLRTNCEDKVVIFYSKEDGALYTFVGPLMRQKLPAKKLVQIALESKPYFDEGIGKGIAFVAERYLESLDNPGGLFGQ